jgi:hypothetical protein
VKEFLSRAGRRFDVRNVDEDPAAYDDLLARGFRTVPITIIGRQAVRGFDPEALTTALDAIDRHAPGQG